METNCKSPSASQIPTSTKSIVAIVFPDVSDDFIIGFPQLKELYPIISNKFPVSMYTISNKNNENFKEMKETICNEFPQCDLRFFTR